MPNAKFPSLTRTFYFKSKKIFRPCIILVEMGVWLPLDVLFLYGILDECIDIRWWFLRLDALQSKPCQEDVSCFQLSRNKELFLFFTSSFFYSISHSQFSSWTRVKVVILHATLEERDHSHFLCTNLPSLTSLLTFFYSERMVLTAYFLTKFLSFWCSELL